MPSSHLILCRPLLLLPTIFPSIRVFSSESALCIRWPSYRVSASAPALPMNIQDWFPWGWTGGSPCCPRDSQESSPAPRFKSISPNSVSWLSASLIPCLPCVHAKSLQLCLTLYDPVGLQPTRLLCPWDSPGNNTRVGCHPLFQGIFLIRVQTCVSYLSSTGRQILYH